MSRKDYEAIAAALRETVEDSRDILGSVPVLRSAATRIAVQLRQDNPRFDAARFMAACGFDT